MKIRYLSPTGVETILATSEFLYSYVQYRELNLLFYHQH